MEPLPDGPIKGEAYPANTLESMLDLYYDYRGWDKDRGWPTKRKLEELGLETVAGDLEKRGLL